MHMGNIPAAREGLGLENRTLVDLFDRWIEQEPSRSAVVCAGQKLSYRELDIRSNQLARTLRAQGVGRDTLVAVCLETSAEMIIAMFGILKAGGAYVALSPSLPQERVDFVLNDTQAVSILTQKAFAKRFADTKSSVLCLDADWFEIAEESADRFNGGVRGKDLAYLIFTSGSTGTPKGVMIEHRNVTAMLESYEQVAPSDQSLVGSCVCPYSFDVSVWEIFSCLCYGGELHLIPQETVMDLRAFTNYLTEHQITSAYIPPTILSRVTLSKKQVNREVRLMNKQRV